MDWRYWLWQERIRNKPTTFTYRLIEILRHHKKDLKTNSIGVIEKDILL